MTNADQLIARLEAAWDIDGFLDHVRNGDFVPDEGEQFLAILRDIKISETDLVPKRLVSLLWFVPIFLMWQVDRIAENGGDGVAYERFMNDVHGVLEDRLGIP